MLFSNSSLRNVTLSFIQRGERTVYSILYQLGIDVARTDGAVFFFTSEGGWSRAKNEIKSSLMPLHINKQYKIFPKN